MGMHKVGSQVKREQEKQGHTPGPWAMGGFTNGDERVIFGPDGEDGAIIATAWPIGDDFNESYPMGETWRETNANLIAAAPELLAALKALVRIAVENLPSTVHSEIGAAFQAINKAEGR